MRARTVRTATLALALAGAAAAAAEETKPAAPRYEMTTYYVAFLKRGPAWTPDRTPEVAKIQEGHMANIRRMAELGKLVVAGPFSDEGDLRGMFVFATASMEEAKALAAEDPAVKAGRLVLEWHPWFAAKGIRVDPPTASSAPPQ